MGKEWHELKEWLKARKDTTQDTAVVSWALASVLTQMRVIESETEMQSLLDAGY